MANLLETFNKKMQERGYTLDTNGKYTKSGNNYTVGGNSGRNTYTSASNKTKSAYQKMLSDEDEEEEEEERERVRSSKRMTNQEVVSKIYEMSKTDKEAANNALSMYRQLQNDPTSAYYNPYRNSTNSALTTLSELGADVSKIDDDWIEGYSWLKEHYLFNGTSNTPSKPGKNASVEEIAAYNYYQVLKSEGQTRKAEQEWAALQEEIKYWTNRSDRNYSDDEILGKINWNNYKTLTAMDESAAQGTPMELNRGIGYSRDNLYGVIWQARNGKSSGSLELDSAMNYTGEGNRWKEDRNISERLDPNSGRFNPYTVGSTLEQEGLYFGQNSFDQSWIDGNREFSYGSDKNSQQNFRNVVEAERTTQAAEKELANVREKMTSLISNSKSPEDAKLKLEEYINSNCPTLKKMNDSLTDGKLLNTTRAIDFDLNDLKAEIDTGVLEQKEKEEAWERELDETVAAGKTSEPAAGPKQVERFTDEQLHLDMNDEDALEAFRQEKGQTGSQTSPDRTAQSTAENAAASLTEEESAFMRERRRAKNNAYRQSADILGDEKTAAEENMYERGNVINFGDTVNRIRGMIDQASDYVSYAFGKYTSRASTNFFNTTLKTHQEITDYEAQKSNLEALQLRSDELAGKLGDKVYAVGDSAPYSMRTTMDINGRDLEVLMERSTDGSGFVIRQYHDPETGDYYNPNGGGTLSEEDFFAQYDRDLVNSKVDASLAGANEFYQKKLDAFLNAPALTEEDQRDLEELQNLSGRIQEAQSYMKEHQTAYDEATEAMTKATKAYDDSVFVLNLFGGDTSALAKNKAIADYVTNFDKYEGTQWAAYNSYNLLQDMYIESNDFDPETGTFGGNSLANAQVVWKAAKEGGDKNNGYVVTVDGTDFVLSNGKDELTEMLADVSFARDYLAEHPEIEVPENYLTNLDRFAGKIEREIKGYDYFLLTANDDYTAKVDEGRELDKQNKGVDWANFDINVVSGDMMGSLDSLPNSNYMTVMEREAYYYLLAKEGKESAMEFYNYLADEQYGVLPVRFTEDVQGFGSDWAKEGLGGFVMSNAVAIASAPVRFLGSGLWYLNSAISGQELNPNSELLAFNNFATATRETSREVIDKQWEPGSFANKVANIGYEIATNRGDSVMMAGIFGNLIPGFDKLAEPAQEFLSALPMGVSAAGDAGAEVKRKGGSDDQAWAIGGITAITEAATEAISLSDIEDARLLGVDITGKSVKDFLVNWVTKAGLSEAFGESLNDVIENTADELIMGELSDHSERVDTYMKTYGMRYDEANAAARRDELMGVLHTALVSYISPGADFIQYASGRFAGYYAKANQLQKLGYDVSIRDVRKQAESVRKNDQNDTHESGEINYDALPALQESIRQFEAEQAAAASAKSDRKNGTSAEGAGALQGAGAEQAAQDIAGNIRNLADASAVQRKNRNERTIVEQEMLASAAGHDRTAQTEAVAGVFGGISEEQNEESNAAAMNLGNVFGKHANVASETQRLLVGAMLGGSDGDVVKLGLKYAALAGEKSAVYQAMQSPAYQEGDQATQARIVEQAALQDMESDSVAEAASKTVHDYRVAEVEKQLIADGALDSVNAAQAEADNAKSDTAKAAEALEQRNAEVDAANEALEAANSEFVNDSGDHAKADQLVHAANEQKKAVAVQQEYQQSHDNAQERQTVAENKLEQTKGEATATLREQAETIVAQQDQERAETRAAAEQEAAQQAEQERIEAEQRQAAEDERTDKAWENMRDQKIEEIMDREYVTGERREQRRKELQERADQIRAGRLDMAGVMNESEGYLAVASLGRKLGMDVILTDDVNLLGSANAEGRYSNGVVYLNSNLIKQGRMTNGQAVVEVALHELTHSLEETKSYGKYSQTVLDFMFQGNDADLRAAIDDKKNTYRQAFGQELSDERAIAEIVADFGRNRLNDRDVVWRFVDNGLGGKIRNALHNINQAIKNFKLTGKERETAEYLRRTERLYQKMIEESVNNSVHPEGGQFSVAQIAQATNVGMVANDETLQLFIPDPEGKIIGNKENGLVDGRRYTEVDGENVKITPDMITSTPVGMLIEMGLSNKGLVDESGAPLLDENGNQRTQQGDARKMFADLMNLCAKYRDNNLIWEIAGSEFAASFSALKSNSDPQYGTTVDFGTICSKTQAIVDVLSGTMQKRIQETRDWNAAHAQEIKEGKLEEKVFSGLDRKDVMMVYDQTHSANLSVPCPVCYVFSRWMGVPSLLGQMNRFQHRFVETVKDENGNTVYDKNGDAVINWDVTKERANKYINDALEKYGSKDAITKAKQKLQKKIDDREEKLPGLRGKVASLSKQLERTDLTNKERKSLEGKLQTAKKQEQKNLDESTRFTNELADVEAFNWVTQALCLQERDGNTVRNVMEEDGVTYKMDEENFRLTPEEILFDLNRTGEFAGYSKNWTYRTTRGAGMGKSIMPYSGASIGDIINGDSKRWTADVNPFVIMDKKTATDAFKRAERRVKQQNLVGGQRFQSTSDFRPEWGLDYVMSFLEMQALGSKVQMYSKVSEAVDFLGSIGADLNESIMGQGNGYHEATSEEIELAQSDTEEGRELKSRMGIVDKKVYVMDFSDVTGMDYNTAKGYSKKYNNVQMILVGMNDIHIKLAMGSDDIDFIIPWHSSGNSRDVIQQLVSSVDETLTESSDYTAYQNDMFKGQYVNAQGKKTGSDKRTEAEKNLYDARVKLLNKGGESLTFEERRTLLSNDFTKELYYRFTLKEGESVTDGGKTYTYDPDCSGVTLPKKQAESVFPYEYWDKTSTRENADVNGQRFVEYCDALGLVPRFSQFKDDPGYWKLLIDRKMYDNNVLNEDGTVKEYGKYREQQVVDITKASIGQLPNSANAKYGQHYSEETQNAIEAANAALSQKYDGSFSNMGPSLADLDIGQINTDYQSAVERGDMEAAAEDVESYAESKGYTEVWSHGTPKATFTSFDLSKAKGARAIFLSDPGTASGYSGTTYQGVQTKFIGNEIETIEDALNEVKRINDGFSQPKEVDGGYKLPRRDVLKLGLPFKSTYTTEDVIDYANRLKNESGGVYNLFVNPGNKLTVDANGAWWNEIRSEYGRTTDQIGLWAEAHGYDSVEIDNVHDGGRNDAIPSDILLVFDGKRLKAAEPVTYDDQGNVIPLSQRFTDNSDIRYSNSGPSLADLDQSLTDSGIVSQEDINAYNANNSGSAVLEGQNPLATTAGGSAQRAFGNGMLQENDEMNAFVKRYVANQNGYAPDSNDAQIDRAIQWIAGNKFSSSSDGLYESIEKVASNRFDYRSADGQARMVALMGMAAYKNDVMAQVTLADAFNRQGTDLGRALQSRKLFRLMTPEGRIGTLQRMMTKTQEETGNTDLKFSEWIYRAAAAAETEEDFSKVRQAAAEELAEQIPASWKEKLNSWRMLSMLGNPRTHIRNIVGNAMFVPVVGLKNKMGAVVEMATGQERTKTLAPVLSKEVRDFARQDAEVMKNELTGEAKYAEGDLVQQERNKKQFKGLFQLLSDVNSKALEGEDWFFLKGHYRRALGGWMQANGYTAEQLQNNQELLDEGREYAISEAQKATYRDFNGLAAKLNGLTRNNNTTGEKVLGFAVNAVLPFRKTPANILKRGVEYSPIGIARSITTDLYHLHQYNEYQDGKLEQLPADAISPTQYIDRLCSGLTGTGIMMMGAFLGSLGAASSGLGDDDDEFEKLRGNQPYSFKLNLLGHDVTFTMDWAAPASMPFFVGTATYEQMQRENGMDIEQILNAMSNITEPVFNLSMLDGVNSLLGVQTSGNDSAIAQLGGKVVSNYATSYIPSIVGATARTIDDTRRKAFVESGKGGGIMGTFRYAGEQVENKIPGLSQTNIPYMDVWGNAETSSFDERLLENFILPGYLNQYNRNDAVVNELDRLYQETGNTDMIPRDANKTFSTTRTVNGEKTASEKYVLTAEQWDAYKTARGQAAYSTIERMLNTPEYQSAPDYEKVSMINEAWDYANQVGKRAVVPDATVDEYVSNGSDPVKAIIGKRAETIQKQTVSNHKSAMLKSLEEGKTEEFATMQEALRRDGKEESDIKGYVADKYRDAYKAAYLAGREDQMDAIRETLNSTGYEFDFAGWEKQAKKKQEEEEEKRRNGQ